MPKQEARVAGDKIDPDMAGRFYSALVGLSDSSDPRQRYRRQVMGMLQGLTAKMRSIGKASANLTRQHASAQYILVLLYRANADHTIKVREIQRGLGFTAGGVTRRLDAMTRDGLLERLPDPADGRALLARLTPAGAELARNLLSRSDERSRRLEEAFTVAEWETLARLMDRLDNVLESGQS